MTNCPSKLALFDFKLNTKLPCQMMCSPGLQNGPLVVQMHICFQTNFCIFRIPFPYFPIFLLVVENYIWQPNPLAGHIQGLHSTIFNRVPFQLVVVPCLEKKAQNQYKVQSVEPPLHTFAETHFICKKKLIPTAKKISE